MQRYESMSRWNGCHCDQLLKIDFNGGACNKQLSQTKAKVGGKHSALQLEHFCLRSLRHELAKRRKTFYKA